MIALPPEALAVTEAQYNHTTSLVIKFYLTNIAFTRPKIECKKLKAFACCFYNVVYFCVGFKNIGIFYLILRIWFQLGITEQKLKLMSLFIYIYFNLLHIEYKN